MQLTLASLVLLATLTCVYAEGNLNPVVIHEKLYSSSDSAVAEFNKDPRAFFTTFTLTLSTTTSFHTLTLTSTCTTSTAVLSTCRTAGRRRRGMVLTGQKTGRGLFYEDDEQETEDGSIFLPGPAKTEEKVNQEQEPSREVRETPTKLIPFVIQPGFEAPSANARFLLAYETSTVTLLTTTVSISTMTARCRSITGYQLCGHFGK